MLSITGLSLIVIGWAEQLYRSLIRKHLSFSPFFLTLYLVGAAMLVFDSFNQANIVSGALNAVTVIIPFILLVLLIIRKGKPGAF